MFTSLKGKFQFVQDGLSASLRNLKIKDDKRQDLSHLSLNFESGNELLFRKETNCEEIHTMYESTVLKAELVDEKIVEIHSNLSKNLHTLQEINGFTSNISKFVKRIESIADEIVSLQTAVAQAEVSLMLFEDLIYNEEMKKMQVNMELELKKYSEQKNNQLESAKKKLDFEYLENLYENEKAMQGALKEKQDLYDMAFQQDMQLYKESGIIPNLRSNEMPSIINLEDVIIEDDLDGLNQLLES